MDDFANRAGLPRRKRLVERLDRMVDSGQVTESEAARLRAAADEPTAFDAAVEDIRARHAGARLDAAVEEGLMTEAEADSYRERIGNGEHPRSLRTHLSRILPRARSRERLRGVSRGDDQEQDDPSR